MVTTALSYSSNWIWSNVILIRKSVWIPIFLFVGTLMLYLYYNADREITKDTVRRPIVPYRVTTEKVQLTSTTLDPDIVMDLAENYFRSAAQQSQGKLLVDTDKCKIPDIDPWVPDVRKITEYVAPKCKDNVINLTYVEYQNVFINEKALETLGYSLENISCCYRTIERVDQTLEEYDHNADNEFQYSETCYPMAWVTAPVSGFILVNCTGKNATGEDTLVYQNLHALAKLSLKEEEKLSPKFSYWQNCDSGETIDNVPTCKSLNLTERPPSVLMLGIDSTSRLNFHRFMNATKRALQEIQAVEMKGYNKVGDNTYPNLVPLMSSYTEEELEELFLPDDFLPMDNCPYLWQNFSRQRYITSHLEDSPKMAIFNYLKTGFVKAPVDFYIRPWMLAAYTEHSEDKAAHFSIDCLGYQRPEEILINYIVDVITLIESRRAPFFITSWLTDLSHDNMNNIQTMDSMVANALLKLHRNKFLDNTIVFVMSDHGYRWGDIRGTTSGWFELKLPTMYIRLPEHIKKHRPSWSEALEYNSNQLTTPFDIHETLKDILRISNSSGVYNSTSKRGQSLFQKVPPRSCDDAQIPMEYCACYPESPNTFDLRVIQLGAVEIIKNINRDLPHNCTRLRARKVTAAVVSKEYRNETYSITDYSISFDASPGDFSFEAIAAYNNTASAFIDVSNVQRTNKKNEDTDCLSEEERHHELFCHCKKD